MYNNHIKKLYFVTLISLKINFFSFTIFDVFLLEHLKIYLHR